MENDNAVKVQEKADGSSNVVATTTNENSTALVSSDKDFQYFELLAAQLGNLKSIASVFVKGGLCPIKKEEDFIVATVTGQQLGLPMMTAVNNIFVVNNKPSLATHLLRALLLKAGIVFNKEYDFEPMYAYYEGEVVNGVIEAKKLEGIPIQRGIAPLS